MIDTTELRKLGDAARLQTSESHAQFHYELADEIDTLRKQRDALIAENARIQALKDSDKSCGEISCDDCNARYVLVRSQRDELVKALNALYKSAPNYLSCDIFHHSKKDRHSWDEICKPSKRYTDAVGRVTKILIKIKEVQG